MGVEYEVQLCREILPGIPTDEVLSPVLFCGEAWSSSRASAIEREREQESESESGREIERERARERARKNERERASQLEREAASFPTSQERRKSVGHLNSG